MLDTVLSRPSLPVHHAPTASRALTAHDTQATHGLMDLGASWHVFAGGSDSITSLTELPALHVLTMRAPEAYYARASSTVRTVSSRWAAQHRSMPRAVPLLPTMLYLVGAATAAAAERCVQDEPGALAVNHSFILLEQLPRQPSPWAGLESDDVLTRSGTEAMGEPAHEALARIRHLGTLSDGWDGTGIVGPNQGAIEDAMTLIAKLSNAGIALRPRIGLDSDGSVGFSFFRDDRAIADMTIPGERPGTYSFYARDGGATAMSDDAPIGGAIPPDLLSILSV